MRLFPAYWIMAAAVLFADEAEVSARNILEAKCIGCHGAAKMAGLDLRTAGGLAKGGTRGPAVKPGDADASLLLRAVRKQGDVQMPPGKESLSAAEIEVLRRWIAGGAKWSGTRAQAEPNWWSFRKLTRPQTPAGKSNPIDAFIFDRLRKEGLRASMPASRAALIRRATFDLHGLPPTPQEIDAFVRDPSPDAYPKLIDRLLASPRYGERWGRHWLDVVRYADTGGFETDVYFANAWRYRDYVIRSFNQDKPYHVFVQEQIAGDEIWPDNLDLEGSYELPKTKLANLEKRIATGLYTLGAMPVEYTFFGDQYRAEWQAEAVETTAAAFLGLTFGCARCHDHKFDPITQKDFYRMSALFAGSEDREVPIVSRMGIYEFTRHQTRWVIADQLKSKLQRMEAAARARHTASGAHARFAYTPAERDERESLLRQIGEAYVRALPQVPKANLLIHSEPVPDTYVLAKGDFQQKLEKVRPGFPASLGASPDILEPDHNLFIPQRRKALAEWLTSPQHPLTARVMVNRIWQGHFGRGIAGTANDLGRQGDPPSHQELLDWLAAEFIASNWSVKAMHKRMMLSETYQFSSGGDAENLKKDADNRYFWRMNRRRLEAEAIRDAVLAVSGVLNTKMFGEPVVAPLARDERDGMRDPQQWPVSSDAAEHDRRSIYHFVKRSFRNPLMETFDAPDSAASCPKREASTVAPQSLAMMNGEFFHDKSKLFAARLRKASPGIAVQVEQAFRLGLGRAPSEEESARAAAYVERNGLDRLCLMIFNMSEFLYVD
ncbi:MAG: PSD1 domain-containing protein [Bryobacterales bacterium]|nr:PSD1 domain-containing protein [Bryobacterales bacterium]